MLGNVQGERNLAQHISLYTTNHTSSHHTTTCTSSHHTTTCTASHSSIYPLLSSPPPLHHSPHCSSSLPVHQSSQTLHQWHADDGQSWYGPDPVQRDLGLRVRRFLGLQQRPGGLSHAGLHQCHPGLWQRLLWSADRTHPIGQRTVYGSGE